jgi:hypothetical protein
MTKVQELLDLEEHFWTQGRTFYREHVDGECLIAFPQMAQVMSNEDVAATVKDDQRWHDVEIVSKGLVEPFSNLAIITYEASAKSHDGKPYKALVSSGYVKRKDGWKMAFHQQTPLPAAA